MTKSKNDQQQQQQTEQATGGTAETPRSHKTPPSASGPAKGPAPAPPPRGLKRDIENLSPSPVSKEAELTH